MYSFTVYVEGSPIEYIYADSTKEAREFARMIWPEYDVSVERTSA